MIAKGQTLLQRMMIIPCLHFFVSISVGRILMSNSQLPPKAPFINYSRNEVEIALKNVKNCSCINVA
jgi:hypothetical protein